MKYSPSKIYRIPSFVFVALYITFATIAITACSNSETIGADIEESAVVHCKDVDTNISPAQEETTKKNDSLKADFSITELTSKDSIHSYKVAEATTKNDSSTAETTITAPVSMDSTYSHEIICDFISEDLPLDDSEYPYAGIPRIVIETKNHQAIKDRETEIPAKLQIWGESLPESDIMDLTIRGRGNTSWTDMPKKSYKIEFVNKQEMLGMPKDRDWALIANHADKTLMMNYLMYHLSAELGAYYAPRCEFVELYLNKEYLGVYLLTETIKIAKHRINISKNEDSYLIEVDHRVKENEQPIYSAILTNDKNKKAFRIHEPQNASKEAISAIKNRIESFERYLKTIDPHKNNNTNQWIDVNEYIKHYWVQEFSKNFDANFATSVYFTWEKGNVIKMGPIWDFDLAFGNNNVTYVSQPQNWYIKPAYWNSFLFKDSTMNNSRITFWNKNKKTFLEIIDKIDSSKSFLHNSAKNNFKKWNILPNTQEWYQQHSYNTYYDACENLKNWIKQRIEWIDSEIEK